MKRRYFIATLLAMPIVAGLASIAEVAMRPAHPSKPTQMQPPVVVEVKPKTVTYQPTTKEQTEQERYARALYTRLNADILSGRRAATKSGTVEREPIEGVDYWVIQGAEPLQPLDLVDMQPDYSDIVQPAVEQTADVRRPDFYRYRTGGYCCASEPAPRTSTSVPEPGSLSLLAAGLVGILFARRLR